MSCITCVVSRWNTRWIDVIHNASYSIWLLCADIRLAGWRFIPHTQPSRRWTAAPPCKPHYLADQLGYDSIWVADHLMLGKDQAIMEGWTTLSAIAGGTQRAKLGIIHQAHFFRYPSVAAKMIATLDQISGGRFIYFADTGTRAGEHQAYGLNYPSEM